jgi:hypothetical protein
MTAAIARPGTLQQWLQPPITAPKRKRAEKDAEDENVSSDDDLIALTVAQPRKKRLKSVSTKSTSKPAKKSAARNTTGSSTSKNAKKLYNDTLKKVEKDYMALDKRVKTMNRNSYSITILTYVDSATDHVKIAEELTSFGDVTSAFNLIMCLADASHRNITSFKMAGEEGEDCNADFKLLDQALLDLIEKREVPAADGWLKSDDLPSVPHCWTNDDAQVGPAKTGNGYNKQQRNLLEAQYIDWQKERRAERRTRRETCADWVRLALDELVADRDYLKPYGCGEYFHGPLKGQNAYFRDSIAKLEELIAARAS